MTFNVRLHAYRGITQVTEPMSKQHHSDSVHIMQEPYEWGQMLESQDDTPVASAPDIEFQQVNVLKVEVPDGQGIRYEVKPPGSTRSVGPASPRLQGVDFFTFYPGWTFEFIDLATAI